MSDLSRITVHDDGIKELQRSQDVAKVLRKDAERLRKRVRKPKHLALTVRSGVSRRGAFAQVRMIGRGAVAIEFGTRRHVAIAPLRSALRGGFR